jgi:hypothetical protein
VVQRPGPSPEVALALDSLRGLGRVHPALHPGVVHGVGLGVLVAVPAFLVLGAGLLLRRHLSLPTKDGRVSIVGLDRELSREALIRYQLRELSGVATYEALPAQRPAAAEPASPVEGRRQES